MIAPKPASPPCSVLDQLWPLRGPCAMCGGPDARHRMFDAMAGRWIAGDSLAVLADDYEVSVLSVEVAVREGLREALGRPMA